MEPERPQERSRGLAQGRKDLRGDGAGEDGGKRQNGGEEQEMEKSEANRNRKERKTEKNKEKTKK